MVWVLLVNINGEEKVVEMVAPDLFTAVTVLASQHPGLQLIKRLGEYQEGQHGTA